MAELEREDVAQAAGVSAFTVGAWERGDETNPTLESLLGISVLLGVSVDWLIHGPRVLRITQAVADQELPPGEAADGKAGNRRRGK